MKWATKDIVTFTRKSALQLALNRVSSVKNHESSDETCLMVAVLKFRN